MNMEKTNSFGNYMLINAAVQTICGFKRREIQQETAITNEQFQLNLYETKEKFQDELDKQKVQDLRKKLQISRQYRAKEKFESNKLKESIIELRTLLDREFPLKDESIPIIIDTIDEYRKLNYNANVPLNVILLHTLGDSIIDYEEISNSLDEFSEKIGNIIFRRWCDKDVARNSALYNLHAMLGNIPTIIISPNYWRNKVHFTISMWDAYSYARPLIRPLFSIDCDIEKLQTDNSKKTFQEQFLLATIAISGCARDSYAFLAHGLNPTFAKVIVENNQLKEQFKQRKNIDILDFTINEYRDTVRSINETDISNAFTELEKDFLLNRSKQSQNIIENI